MPKKLVSNLLRDWSRRAVADHDAIDGPDGRDFGGSSSKEDFIGDVEQLTRDGLFDHRKAEVAGDGHDRVTGDARKALELASGGVYRTPLRTTNTFSPEPSETSPLTSSAIPSE